MIMIYCFQGWEKSDSGTLLEINSLTSHRGWGTHTLIIIAKNQIFMPYIQFMALGTSVQWDDTGDACDGATKFN